MLFSIGHILGTLPQWLMVLGLCALVVLMRGGQVGPALGYMREANTTLEKENAELKKALAEERKENAAMKAKTDLEPLQRSLLESITEFGGQNTREHERMIALIGLIADRLGPDPDLR